MTTPLADSPAAALGQEVAAARAESSPAWLAARRRIAWDAYEAIPMPSSQRDEDWRRTDISALHPEAFHADRQRRYRGRRRDARTARPGGAHRRVHHRLARGESHRGADTLLAQGIIVTTLEEAALVHPELVQRAFAAVRVDEFEIRRALECALAGRRLRVRPPRCRGARARLDRPPGGGHRPRGVPVHRRRTRRGQCADGHRRVRIARQVLRRSSATRW